MLYISIGMAVCFITDLLDGAAARKLNCCTEFGSKFDSLADQALQISSIFWILMLVPVIFTENLIITISALTIYILSLLVGLIKFHRMANLHLYLSKFGGLILYIFLIHSFYYGDYSKPLFLLAGTVFILSSLETLILQLTRTDVDSNIGSILFRYLEEGHPIRYWLSKLP
jgi:phosphatidylglycerophosphate synthase